VFSPWRELSDELEIRPVQYPGRENRFGEPAALDIGQLADGVADAIRSEDARPFVLFGHSMGAIVAAEVAYRLDGSARAPKLVIVSGSPAPQYRQDLKTCSTMSDDELIDVIKAMGGTDMRVFHHPELVEVLLETVRADFTALENYRFTPRLPLTCPITVFSGAEDAGLELDQVVGWREHTSAAFDMRDFPGGHFYLWDMAEKIISYLEQTLL
jgi:surfactin synthase thioesterase subunit